jgi:YegS/Rv2252/BmrU family lipid kinase
MKHIAIVCNPTPEAATKAVQLANAIVIYLQRKNIIFSLFTNEWPQKWTVYTEVWIVGGDGTLNYFINHYQHIQLPLTIFKGGSGNDFHWMLYGDIKMEDQIEQVLQGKMQLVDMGECNGQLFLNGIGIGFDGAIVKDLLGKNKVAGKASYLLSILKNIVRFSEKPCTLHLNGQSFSQDCFMISVANGKRYGGGFHVAPKANLTDGLLDVNIVGKIPSLRRLKYLPVIEKGEHLGLPFNQYLNTESIKITSTVYWHAHIDGEYITGKEFNIKIDDKKLGFLV